MAKDLRGTATTLLHSPPFWFFIEVTFLVIITRYLKKKDLFLAHGLRRVKSTLAEETK